MARAVETALVIAFQGSPLYLSPGDGNSGNEARKYRSHNFPVYNQPMGKNRLLDVIDARPNYK
jgi:hypothetical protein